MATWTNIPDSVLEPGKPARSVDALALRDNAIAIAEGAAGAPRIAGQQGPAVHTGGIVNGAVTNEKIANMDASKLTGTINGARIPTGLGGVGTYALLAGDGGNINAGHVASGSQLKYASVFETGSNSPSGSWRRMGWGINTTVWVRIS